VLRYSIVLEPRFTEYIAEWAKKLKNKRKLCIRKYKFVHFMEINACPGAVCSVPEWIV